MDQGAAAVWAAGIGVGGVVVTAGMGWYAARKAAAAAIEAAQRSATAQVEAALAGVRAQISGQRREVMWQVRREAYGAFLAQIEALHMQLMHTASLCAVAVEDLSSTNGVQPELSEARAELTESFKALWFRESALRLTVDQEESDAAEALMKVAWKGVADIGDLINAIFTDHNVGPPQQRSEASRAELLAGIKQWTRNVREKLESDGQT